MAEESGSNNSNNSKAATFSLQTKTVIIDSRDRDPELFPNPAQYEVLLDEDIQDVLTLELMGMELPMVSYLVREKNSAVPFTWSNASPRVAYLRPGDYTAAELAVELQTGICAALGDAQAARVRYVARLDNFEVRGKQPFVLNFQASAASRGTFAKNVAARLLGFGAAAYASRTDAAGDPLFPELVASEFRKDFETDRYAILHIEPAYVNQNAINGAINKSFAIVPRCASAMNLCAEQLRTKTFRPPVPKFAKVRIRLLEPDGAAYDCQNRDHRIELRFSCIRQKKYTQQQFAFPFEGVVSEK